MQAASKNGLAIASNLLRGMNEADHPSQLQLLKDTCATAFVGELLGITKWILLLIDHHL